MAATEPTLLHGMSEDDLRVYLAALQKAYVELSMGAKVVSATYSQGDGNRSVTYRQPDISTVSMLIRQIQQQLGIIPAVRRPLRFKF